MRLIILILLACGFGYGVLQINRLDPDNYVKMYIGSYVVEVKVLGFLLMVLGIVIVLYFILWLIRAMWRSPNTLAKWKGRRNQDKAEEQLGAGYLSLIKGDWRKAETQLTSKSQHSRLPYVNYLAAAQAAQQQGRTEKRDEYLQAAYKAAPKERLAIGLTKARLHQQAGQIDLALATLRDVENLGKKNPQYTAMLLQALDENNDWQQAQQLLPAAKKQAALPETVLDEIRDKVNLNTLQMASNGSADELEAAWRSLPRDQKKNLKNVEVYTAALAAKGEAASAEKLIRATLKHSWSERLVSIYGNLSSDNPAKTLRRIEGWLMARPESAELNLAAGRLAIAAKNNDAAKQYLQTAISLAQMPEAYKLLGEVFESSNESGKALQLYRAGMAAASGGAEGVLIEPAGDS